MMTSNITNDALSDGVKRICQWIVNILDDFSEEFEHTTLKPEYAEEFKREALQGMHLLVHYQLYQNIAAMEELCKYLDQVHTDLIDRTQTRYITRSIWEDVYFYEILPQRERYGFYKNNRGIIIPKALQIETRT